jgi:hypothetical protein
MTYWCISSSLAQRLVENSWNNAFMVAALKAMEPEGSAWSRDTGVTRAAGRVVGGEARAAAAGGGGS